MASSISQPYLPRTCRPAMPRHTPPRAALVTTASRIAIRPAVAPRARGTCNSLAMVVWARTVQTPPGMYLPSCPIRKTRWASRSLSCEPRPASSARQAGTPNQAPIAAASSDNMTGTRVTRDQACATSDRLFQTQRTAKTTTTARNPNRSKPTQSLSCAEPPRTADRPVQPRRCRRPDRRQPRPERARSVAIGAVELLADGAPSTVGRGGR